MSRYHQVIDGRWELITRKCRVACCDCGAVHDEEYRLVRLKTGGRGIENRTTKNARATAAMRRALGVRIVKQPAREKREGINVRSQA